MYQAAETYADLADIAGGSGDIVSSDLVDRPIREKVLHLTMLISLCPCIKLDTGVRTTPVFVFARTWGSPDIWVTVELDVLSGQVAEQVTLPVSAKIRWKPCL